MKRFKTKRKNNKLIILFFMIIFFIIFIVISFHKLNMNCTDLINYLLSKTNFSNEKNNAVLAKLSSNLDYLIKPFYFNKKEELVIKEENPIIYLYNTHDTEKYSDNKSVIDASYLLQNNLKKLGITSLVEERKVSDLISTGLSNYNVSRNFILDIKEKNSDIKYYIDIHRDSVNNTSVTINNKKYAKILFVLGLDNPNYEENKKIISKLNDYLNNNYPGISKGILEKKGEGVDGVYNQDISKNVMLIEIGGIENNIEEVNNSTEIISLMLYNNLGDKDEKEY